MKQKWVTLSITIRELSLGGRTYSIIHKVKLNPAQTSILLFSTVRGFSTTEISTKLPKYYTMRDLSEAMSDHRLKLRKLLAKVLKERADK